MQRQVDALKGPAGCSRCTGPAVTVTLSDAPKSEVDRAVKDGETTADQLVVHQQDIQAVVNALWSGGAEAMTLQKQRVVSTTGIKCVGNTVVLHGVPYAPPYVITAVGDVGRDAASRSTPAPTSPATSPTCAKYNLGYDVTSATDSQLPGYDGGGSAALRDAVFPTADSGPTAHGRRGSSASARRRRG